MNLILKVLIVAVVIIALIVGLRYVVSSTPQHVSEAQAVNNITGYIKTSYPGAAVNITSVNASQATGSWQIIASVVINGTRACPSFYIYSFDYPEYGFVSRQVNNYTSNCIINERQSNGNYSISSYPIAIVRGYDINASGVSAFVSKYGYYNVSAQAAYLTTYYYPLSATNYTDVWQVNYTSPYAANIIHVIIDSQNGALITRFNST